MEYEDQIEQEVMAEARQAAGSRMINEEENSDYSGDDITEFTITNDINNPEVVRRSKRVTKIKNYAEFLKDELGSDIEDNVEIEEEGDNQEQGFEDEDEEPQQEAIDECDTIKPIIRSEGTKVYSRRNVPERPKLVSQIDLPESNSASLSTITQPQTLNSFEHLSRNISKLPDKEIFNMKIGDKTVTVQKLLLTKEQMKAMAKEGKIEKKGNTLLLKKNAGQSFQNSLDSFFGNSKSDVTLKPQFKKTYQRKSVSCNDDNEMCNESLIVHSINFNEGNV